MPRFNHPASPPSPPTPAGKQEVVESKVGKEEKPKMMEQREGEENKKRSEMGVCVWAGGGLRRKPREEKPRLQTR